MRRSIFIILLGFASSLTGQKYELISAEELNDSEYEISSCEEPILTLTSAIPCNDPFLDFYFDGDFLFWQARVEQLQYALLETTGPKGFGQLSRGITIE